MGNCCCRPKSESTSKEIDGIIQEEETIQHLKENFNPKTFNDLFNQRRKRNPDQVMMGYFQGPPKGKMVSVISLF